MDAYYAMQWPRENLFCTGYIHEVMNFRYNWHGTEYELNILLHGRAEYCRDGESWLLEEDDGTVVSFVDGMTTDEPTLRDEMYENAALHDKDGTWQMIFGVNTLPAYRCRGCAGAVLERVIADARAQGRRGCVLTCKDKLVHYYEKFGFVNEGVSQSTHGGVVWYDMRLTF